MFSKVIFDSAHLATFLKMAKDEGLVSFNKDSFLYKKQFAKIDNFKPSELLRKSVCEQLVLTPNILMYYHKYMLGNTMYTGWNKEIFENLLSGKLVEEGVIGYIDSPSVIPETFYSPDEWPVEIITELANSNGLNIGSIDNCYEILKLTYEYISLETDGEGGTVSPEGILTYLEDKNMTSKQKNLLFKYKNAHNITGTLYSFANQYLGLLNSSKENNTMFKSTIPRIEKNIDINQIKNDRLMLFRVTCDKMGKLPYRSTLTDTLNLSQNSATISLRKEVNRWFIALNEGRIDEIEGIINQIRYANKQLDILKDTEKLAKYITYIGAPLSIFSSTHPFLAALGISLSIAGAASTFEIEKIKKNYDWVMFGERV